jgi:iron(III) transport system substrate-binding protein
MFIKNYNHSRRKFQMLVRKTKIFIVLLIVMIVSAACAPAVDQEPLSEETPADSMPEISGELVLYSGRSEQLIQPVIDAFRVKYPDVEVLLKAGNNSELANALIEEQANPQADIFITTELFTVQSLAQSGVFQSYVPAGADLLPAEFLGADNMWTGLTRRVCVIMYNTDLVSTAEAPTSIFDLIDPKWKGQIAAAGSTNGSMQAQIAAMQQLLGEETTEEWLNSLLANDVTFFGGHTDVRKAVGAGEFKIGLVNHYYYYLQQAEGSNVGVVFPDQGEGQIGLITNATAAAVVKGAPHPSVAQAFLDFLVSMDGQMLFADGNYEYPLGHGVAVNSAVQPWDDFRVAGVEVV